MSEIETLTQQWAAWIQKPLWQCGIAVLVVGVICRVGRSIPAGLQAWFWRLAVLKFTVAALWLVPVDLPILPASQLSLPDAGSPVQVATRWMDIKALAEPETVTRSSLYVVLFLVWVIGVVWQLVCLARSAQKAEHWRRTARPVTDKRVLALYACCMKNNGHYKPDLLESEKGEVPFLVGVRRSAIVLPASLLKQLSEGELAMILRHELAHHARKDIPWGLAASLVRAIFFFNPLAWFAELQLRLAQEAATDAVAARQYADRAEYAKLLVSVVEKLRSQWKVVPCAVGISGHRNSLHWRLSAMQYVVAPTPVRTAVYGCLLGAFVVTSILPWRLVAADQSPKKAESSTALPKLFLPSLGQERQKVLDLVGKQPFEAVTLASGIESLRFKSDAGRCYVEISPTTGKVIQVYYFKPTEFTAKEKEQLHARNAMGGNKFSSRGPGELETEKYGKEFMFAVLADSEKKSP